MADGGMTFWDHLDELRKVLMRILLITAVAAVVAFVMKDELFSVVLAPSCSGLSRPPFTTTSGVTPRHLWAAAT